MKLKPTGPHAALALELGAQARSLGIKAWVVGGCVRDWLLGRRTKDMDIVADAQCEALAQYCRRKYGATVESFGSFGTMRCFFPDGARLDLANARKERYPNPAALPLVSPASIEKDLARRDFNVNAMAASILPENIWELHDPFGGQEDMSRGLLRVLHYRSFTDDPPRMYRACRFAGRFGWKLHASTAALMRKAAKEGRPSLLSRARLRQELWRILEEKRPEAAFRLMRRYGLDDFIFPGLRWNPAMAATSRPEARLGVLACCFGQRAEKFLSSLELERQFGAELKAVVAMHYERRVSAKALSALQKSVLRACNSGLPEAALRPAVVGGTFLRAQGLEPGRAFAEIITAAARAQWQGHFCTLRGATAWLKKYMRA